MSLIELIGFGISLLAFLYLSMHGSKDAKKGDEEETSGPLDILTQTIEEEKRKAQRERKEQLKKAPPKKIGKEVPPFKRHDNIRPVTKQEAYGNEIEEYNPFKTSIESRSFQSEIERRKFKSQIDQRSLKLHVKGHKYDKMESDFIEIPPTRGENTLKELSSLKQLIILDAILNKPKGW